MVKDHPFCDGNKRAGAALFAAFLHANARAFDAGCEPHVTNNNLAAVTLLIAASRPEEKDVMIDLVMRLMRTEESYG